MARSDVHPVHRFESWQVWPGSFDNPPVDGNYPMPDETGLKISKSTPIASLGSCFAREIKRRLLQRDYNYLTEETHHPAAVHGSAAWERVYNTFCLRQIFEYTFEDWQPDLRWWIAPQSQKVQDPYRRVILYDSLEAAEIDFERHRQHSRNALQGAEVLILTLGLTEIWRDREDGSVISLPSGPYVNEGGDMDRYEFRVSRYRLTCGRHFARTWMLSAPVAIPSRPCAPQPTNSRCGMKMYIIFRHLRWPPFTSPSAD